MCGGVEICPLLQTLDTKVLNPYTPQAALHEAAAAIPEAAAALPPAAGFGAGGGLGAHLLSPKDGRWVPWGAAVQDMVAAWQGGERVR